MLEVIFDVETKKLFNEITTDNPADLGVSIVSAYIRDVTRDGKEISGAMHSFWEDTFQELFTAFSKADRIIGFNTKYFDVPTLKPYTSLDLTKLNHFDIMDYFRSATGRRISLNSLAQANLGTEKVDKGTNAVLYWKEHTQESLAKLKYYCEADVAITRDIYDFGVTHGFLKYIDAWNNPQKAIINFSYPKEAATQQIGLF